jgi:FKBP-type peptidyl-prolyl cis-trans isomerase (trigger factor)
MITNILRNKPGRQGGLARIKDLCAKIALMQIKSEKQAKSTMKLTVTVPAEKVKEAYDKVLSEVVKEAELPGFRKGMVPAEMVKEKTDVSKLYGEVINELLQKYYVEAVNQEKLNPVSNPKVEIKEFDLEKDFEFTAIVPTKPEVKIGDYTDKLKKIQEEKMKTVKEENAKKLAAGEQLEEPHVHISSNEVVDALVDSAEVDISDILIDDESERMMARLVDQAQSIGISLEQYLKAQNKTADQLREDYHKVAERTLKAEFVLSQLVKDRGVEITEDELTEIVEASGTPNAEEQLKDPVQKWYIKSVLEKNKLISDLIEEAAGHEHK